MPGSGMCFGGKRCEKGQWRPIPWMKIIPFTKPLMEQSSLGLVWRQEEKAVQRVFSFQESWRGRRGPNMWPTLKTWSSFKTIQRCTSPKVVDKLHDAYKVKPVWLYKSCTSLWDNVTYPPKKTRSLIWRNWQFIHNWIQWQQWLRSCHTCSWFGLVIVMLINLIYCYQLRPTLNWVI